MIEKKKKKKKEIIRKGNTKVAREEIRMK